MTMDMANSFKRLPTDFHPGDPIRARDANETNEVVNRMTRGVAPPQQVSPDPVSGSGASIACIIVTIHANHLVCRRKSGGGTINVARPLAARSPASETIFGQTWTYTYTDVASNTTPPSGYQARTATRGTQTEEQIVLRPYTAGSEIRAVRVIDGTGVSEANVYEEVHSDRTWYRKQAAT